MSQPRFVYAVFNFPGTTEEDLPLTAGERIEVLYRDDEFGDGWWEGINEAGQQGLFPKIYTSETYPSNSAGASLSSLNDSLARVDEEPEESDVSTEQTQDDIEPDPAEPHKRLSPEDVKQWSPQQVARHFEELGLGDVAPKFKEHEVSGRILLAMQHTDLREIDINAFGKRFEIMREIDVLRHTEMTTDQYMQQLGTQTPVSTPPLDFNQRSSARKSRIMPQDSATAAMLADSTSSGDERSTDKILPLVPRSTSTNAISAEAGLAPAIVPNVLTHARDDSGFGSSDVSSVQEVLPSSTKQGNIKPAAITSLHRKSLSTSSLNMSGPAVDAALGRQSPEKRHSRSWSQDTVKLNAHKRGPSGGLDAVGEENTGSIGSSDSTPRSPSSTLNSPKSGAQTSPSTGTRPALVSKKSLLGRRPKWRPNAVTENLENISAPESAKDAELSGFLRKRGERSYNWKLRYFVLKGTRLAYYQTDRDTSEKGLIDINSHKVVPIDDILFYGPTRHTFKLIPPAPGASRALNFTPPKTHYFCAESKEQMRQWIAVLTKATIGRDWSTPVISSCTTKTISLKAAREQHGMGKSPAAVAGLGLEPGIDLESASAPAQTQPDSTTPTHIASSSSPPPSSPVARGKPVRSGSGESQSSLRRPILAGNDH